MLPDSPQLPDSPDPTSLLASPAYTPAAPGVLPLALDGSEPTGAPEEFGLLIPSVSVKDLNRWQRQELFLAQYRTCGYTRQSAEAIGLTRWAVDKWLQTDAYGFKTRYEAAHRDFVENWERDIIDARIKDPQGNRGSDPLVMFRTKKIAPEYREDVKLVLDTGVKDMISLLRRNASVYGPATDAQVRELPPGQDPPKP